MNRGPLTLLALLGYALLEWLGLLLAIPPGYASPIFPAAGFAIALTLCYGAWSLPGIWLGSFILNLLVSLQNEAMQESGFFVALLVASGSVLQAWIARLLVLRWQGEGWRMLATERDIARFMVLSAPLACLVSASAGIGALFLAGLLPRPELLFSWWNWWLGDMLGVLLFAPLSLCLLLRRASPWRERLATVALPMLVSLALVTAVFLAVSRWEVRQQVEQIAQSGKRLAQLLDHRLVAHQESLSALRRLIEVTPAMAYPQFEYFTRITLQDNPDLFALSYNPFTRLQERAAFERVMAAQNALPGFRITERTPEKILVTAEPRYYYVPVGYIAPLEGNRPAVGYDINSDPVRRVAIDQAIRTGRPAVTEPIRLVQERQQRIGVLVLHPAYRGYQEPDKGAPLQLIGFAVGVIKVDELVEIAIRDQLPEGLVVRLTDPQAGADRQQLYHSPGSTERAMVGSAERFGWSTGLMMADRSWTLQVYPTPDYLREHRSWFAWGIGVAGLLFSALLQMMMLAMSGRTFAVQQQVERQTEALVHAKEQLEEVNRSLQQRVEQAVSDLREKDLVLIRQGRLAAMGEMIGNIAHQWRQPLNALSILISNIQLTRMNDELTDQYMAEAAANANRLIQKMSSTINDFRNFYHPDKAKVPFSARQQINAAVELVEAAFKNSGIAIQVVEGPDSRLIGFPNEFSQVLLNLMSNARDAILETGAKNGLISISLVEQDGMGVVTVQDNGGGMPEQVRDKIFEPYFSTKNTGTGIGLYMSKMIIERNMQGRITVRPVEGGSAFDISAPLAGEALQPAQVLQREAQP